MMLQHARSCCLVLLAGLAVAQIASPAGLKTCADDLPDVAECRRSALQEAVPLLAAGMPQLGAAPIDPMDQLPPLQWQAAARGLDLSFRLDDSRFTGLGRSVVDDLQVDTVNHRIRVVTHIDGVNTLEGAYRMSGKVLGVPLDGSGFFNLTMSGGSADVTYAGHMGRGDGGDSYLIIDSVSVKLELGDSHYELTGLFGDYEPLTRAGNLFINSMARHVVQPAMVPTLEAWLAEAYGRRAQAVFTSVPYQQLFPRASTYTALYTALFPQFS